MDWMQRIALLYQSLFRSCVALSHKLDAVSRRRARLREELGHELSILLQHPEGYLPSEYRFLLLLEEYWSHE